MKRTPPAAAPALLAPELGHRQSMGRRGSTQPPSRTPARFRERPRILKTPWRRLPDSALLRSRGVCAGRLGRQPFPGVFLLSVKFRHPRSLSPPALQDSLRWKGPPGILYAALYVRWQSDRSCRPPPAPRRPGWHKINCNFLSVWAFVVAKLLCF